MAFKGNSCHISAAIYVGPVSFEGAPSGRRWNRTRNMPITGSRMNSSDEGHIYTLQFVNL